MRGLRLAWTGYLTLRPCMLVAAALGLASCGNADLSIRDDLLLDGGESLSHVVIVTIDTLRSDALGCYGNTEGHTPNLDALADAGVVFERSYAPMATTFPSHSTLFTGLYPRTHGVRWNAHTLKDRWTTLAERLQAVGYSTGAFVSYQSMVNRGGLSQGFETVSDPTPQEWTGPREGQQTLAMATEWLGQQAESPFLLWVHLFEPHTPYPPLPALPRSDTPSRLDQLMGPLADGTDAEELMALPKGFFDDPVQRDALRALYHSQVRVADDLVGQLMLKLDTLGLRKDTFVVVLGDHGQLLGEKGRVGHGPLLDEGVLQTPLIMDEPGPRHGPSRVTELAGVIDVMPTILDALGVRTPPDVQGRSLLPALRGQTHEGETYFAEVRTLGPDSAHAAHGDSVAVLSDEFKLTLTPKGIALYKLDEDPQELSPLSPDALPEIYETLLVLARQHQRRKAGEPVAHASEALDEEVMEELRALGYLK